ncbi:MAG: RecX family transcriptional regulator [Bacteroidales bacterium]|nr:RecX family transcriptional regulator [Bacteroidales bacterium]
MEESGKKVLDKLQAQCSRREYCSSDVYAKALKALEGDEDGAVEVLEALKADKYVDDLRYASAFAREKASLSGWGKVKIRYMLSSKGIPGETISRALDEIDSDAAGRRMENVLMAKYRLISDDPQAKIKLLKFALSRGYQYDDIKSFVDGLFRK